MFKTRCMVIRLLIFIFAAVFLPRFTAAQQLTQSIKGAVVDKSSQQPIVGAAVYLSDKMDEFNAVTDFDGRFEIKEVPVGRISLECRYIGYETWLSEEINLTSGSALILQVELLETAYTTETVTISARSRGGEPLNEMTLVSARSFTVEETSRYASSVNDPGRMAMGFPGVQPSRDTRNDIIIRGNSPAGMLWRLEGIDIPNPNHFARKGSSGGGITIFSASMLGNSDFSSGAFPAEYGNAFSGVMDIHFRKGNDQNRQYTFRVGLLGLDFSTEGPIKKGKSSYLLNYRYSTLGILNSMGINLVGARINNTFQDFSFNIASRSENNKHLFNLWAISGTSLEDREPTEGGPESWISFDDYNVYDFRTQMAAVGAKHTYLIDNNSYIRTSLAVMGQDVLVSNDTLNTNFDRTPYSYENYINSRITLSSVYSRKFSARVHMKAGAILSLLRYNLTHRVLSEENDYRYIIREKDFSGLVQPYAQARITLNPKTTLTGGIHGLYLALNNTYGIDPRLGLKVQLNERNKASLALGQHSAILPIGSYFTRVSGDSQPNRHLPVMRSYQAVFSYEILLGEDWKLQVEPYFQYMTNVPVAADPASTYYMLNDWEGFVVREVIPEGKGRNYGVDIIVERFFRRGTYLISSVSLFDTKYRALNGNWYNTLYNSNVSATLMAGKEWALRNNQSFQIGTKILFNNGILLTPLAGGGATDRYSRFPVLNELEAFSERIEPYFRPDLRLAWTRNNPRNTVMLALDVQNILGRRNMDGLARDYNPDFNEWVFRRQSGLTPIISFQISF